MVSRTGAHIDRILRALDESHPAWLVAPLVMGLLCLGDALAIRGPNTVRTVLAALCVGTACGGILGLGLTLGFHALKRASPRVRAATWSVVGLAVALWLCEALAVRSNWGGPYDRLARTVLAGSLGVGALVSLMGWSLQPTPEHPAGWLGHLHSRWRILLLIASVVGACSLSWAERRGYVVEYPSATRLARWLSLALSMFSALGLQQWWSAHNERASAHISRLTPWGMLGSFVLAIPLVGTVEASRLTARSYPSSALEALRLLTDVDGDGQSSLFGSGDCRPLDASVGPLQREIPDNGIDDNCRAGDWRPAPSSVTASSRTLQPTTTTSALEPKPSAQPPRPTGVVYITVDTVGAASLRSYGSRHDTTPHLDAWAQNAVIFDEAYTCGSSTALALGGTFRGVYPRRLAWSPMVRDLNGRMLPAGKSPRARGERLYRLPFRDPRASLPGLLEQQGVQTFAVSAMHLVARDAGLVGAFQQQIALTEHGSRVPDDAGATQQALTWLAELGPQQRYFMWVHYLGPHTPSTKAEDVPSFGDTLQGEHDHEIATFDRRVAPLLDELSARQRRGENVAVIVSADHGEEFMVRRFHGHSVSDRVAHVPLFLSAPGVTHRHTRAVASSVDVFPTVLGLFGLPIPDALDGRDLMPVARGEINEWSRVVFTDGWVNDAADHLQSNQVVAIDGHTRLRLDFTTMAEELIDLDRERAGALLENQLGIQDDSTLRAALTSYLEQSAVDPRVE